MTTTKPVATTLNIPSTYRKGVDGVIQLILGGDLTGALYDVVFQTWSVTAGGGAGGIEGAVTVTTSPWVYPVASLNSVQDGLGYVQAILRDKNGKTLLKLPATSMPTVFTTPILTLDGVPPIGTIDLGGGTVTLTKQFEDNGTTCIIQNGAIKCSTPIEQGAFKVINGGELVLNAVTVALPDFRCFVMEQWNGGAVLSDVVYNWGTLLDGHGGGNLSVVRPVCSGIPSQYGVSTFEQNQAQPYYRPVPVLIVDCTPKPGGTTPVWEQGQNQALLRQMNALEAHYIGLNIRKNPNMVGPAEVFQPRSCKTITTVDKSMIDGDVQCGRMAWEVPPFPWVMANLQITNTTITGALRVEHGTTQITLSNVKIGSLSRYPGCKFSIGSGVYVGGKLITK